MQGEYSHQKYTAVNVLYCVASFTYSKVDNFFVSYQVENMQFSPQPLYSTFITDVLRKQQLRAQ